MNSVARVKELAAERNLTLYALAEKSGICYSTLRKAEKKESQFRFGTIERLCKGLEIPVKEFSAGKETKQSNGD